MLGFAGVGFVQCVLLDFSAACSWLCIFAIVSIASAFLGRVQHASPSLSPLVHTSLLSPPYVLFGSLPFSFKKFSNSRKAYELCSVDDVTRAYAVKSTAHALEAMR